MTTAYNNTISLSTVVYTYSQTWPAAVTMNTGSSSNTFSNCDIRGGLAYGMSLTGGANYNTISQSTVTSNPAAVYLSASSSNTIQDSFIRSSAEHAIHITGSGGTLLTGNTLVATQADQCNIYTEDDANAIVNLFITSNTMYASPSTGWGAGVRIQDVTNHKVRGVIVIASNTMYGGFAGIDLTGYFATGTKVLISSNTIHMLS